MKLYAGKCNLCGEWFEIGMLALVWQESEGVFRGICHICNDELEAEAKLMDWDPER